MSKKKEAIIIIIIVIINDDELYYCESPAKNRVAVSVTNPAAILAGAASDTVCRLPARALHGRLFRLPWGLIAVEHRAKCININ